MPGVTKPPEGEEYLLGRPIYKPLPHVPLPGASTAESRVALKPSRRTLELFMTFGPTPGRLYSLSLHFVGRQYSSNQKESRAPTGASNEANGEKIRSVSSGGRYIPPLRRTSPRSKMKNVPTVHNSVGFSSRLNFYMNVRTIRSR